MTRIVAPSRLHFGLFHVPAADAAESGRRFGGVGLMIDQPGTVVTVRRAATWQVEGTLANRAQIYAQRFLASLPESDAAVFQVLVERCPPEHVGLGVGTQLGLTVAKALGAELGFETLSASDLAERVGRGERSAVGIHGFDRGGLIVEAGKLPHEAVSPLLNAVELPVSWRVVVAIPAVPTRWHGDRERSAFAKARTSDESRLSERLTRIAFLDLLPAAQAGDLAAFGEAVTDYNRLAGEPFAAEQGGTYASAEVAALIASLQDFGVRGAGQSSWGPAVFGFVDGDGEAHRVLSRLAAQNRNLQAFVTRVNTGGAVLQSSD